MDDPVAQHLAELARAAFGVMGATRQDIVAPRFGHMLPLASVVYSHPAHPQFVACVLNDPELQQLFPASGQSPAGRQGGIIRSTGAGTLMQVEALPVALIGSAYSWARNSPDLSPDQLADKAIENLRLVRRLLRRERVDVPARLAFTNVLLPSDVRLRTPWGPLRAVSEEDRMLAAPGLEGQRTHTFSETESVTVNYSGDMLLETTVPLAMEIRESLDVDQASVDRLSSARELNRRTVLIQLTFMLALERQPPVSAIRTWEASLDPFDFGTSVAWGEARSTIVTPPYALRGDDMVRVEEWTELVDRAHHPTIEVAVRRALMAATLRTDPTDALIDAVIGWENLFGAGAGELTFRISTAMAWLLESSPELREQRQKEVVDIYATRSRVLHGAEVDPRTLASHSARALDLLLQALRKLYRTHPALISQKDRARRLVLGL